MAGGGIGVDYSLKGLPKMLPGLILCIALGWMALQWDQSIHKWAGELKEVNAVLKIKADGKEFPAFEAYKAGKDEKWKADAAKAEAAGKPKPSKPALLSKDDYQQVTASGAVPFKFSFGDTAVKFQLTYVAVLLLLGMLIRNTVGIPEIFKAGTVAARPIIKPGIVILGAYYMWADVLRVGVAGLALVLVFVLGTCIMISIWGRRSKVDEGLAGIMAAGVGVCGVSAAVAVAPVVNAKPRDFFYAIGTILLFGTLGLFTFPYIGKALNMSEPVFGAWVGTAILNTAQLVAAASWYGHQSLLTANIINIVRVGIIPALVIWTIYFYVIRPSQAAGVEGQRINYWEVVKEKFPIFIIGFFLMVTMNQYGMFTKEQANILGRDLLKIFFAIGFAGVGLNIALGDLRKAGGKAFVIGFVSAVGKAALSAAAVMMLGAEFFTVK
jgi:uncharacterized integral membrane protein (TIGR00698 family)